MNNDRFEDLLRGYRLPAVSSELDRRVLSEGTAIVARVHPWSRAEEIGRQVLHGLGFGYLTWLVDLVTATDAEYRVEFI